MNFRVLLVAVVVSGAALASAQAADQSVPGGSSYYPRAAYTPTSVSWNGFYVGLQLGGNFGFASWANPISGLPDEPNAAAPSAGGQVGVNWMFNSWLVGVEADFSGMELEGSTTDAAGLSHIFRSTWMSLMTGRLGYATGRYLFYAKGGAAFANERNKVGTTQGIIADTGMTTQYGYTVGAGAEYALDPNWSMRLEYDFVDLPSRSVSLVGCAPVINEFGGAFGTTIVGARCGGPGSLPAQVNFFDHKIVGAINYRF
jgi:outer membrane immunogenic protein